MIKRKGINNLQNTKQKIKDIETPTPLTPVFTCVTYENDKISLICRKRLFVLLKVYFLVRF